VKKKRKGFTLIELLVVVAIIALLISILLPSLSRARELTRRAVCGANLRGMGQGMHIYSNDNQGSFPQQYYDSGNITAPANGPATSEVDYVAWMGSRSELKISQATAGGPNTVSSRGSHPCRGLFMLVIGGSTPGSFVCPSASDTDDDLRNYGPDSAQGSESAAQPGKTRFDFRGYTYLSYAYQVPYGRKGKPKVDRDTRMPVAADKGPYYQSGGPGLANTRTVKDERSDLEPMTQIDGETDERLILKVSVDSWRPYNSQNHGGEGQEILFTDSHVKFERRPIEGVNNDNIYTASNGITAVQHLFGTVASGPGGPGGVAKVVPRVNTDSYLVP